MHKQDYFIMQISMCVFLECKPVVELIMTILQ